MIISDQERRLCQALQALPKDYKYRYGERAAQALLRILFRYLVNCKENYLETLFQSRLPKDKEWILREAQGAYDGSEYTEAARGKACGHIFKNGEVTYRCKTCSLDDTCVLCSRCFEASDHQGHVVYVSISPGNSGCCDCGDTEAWRIPVSCAIHTLEHYTHASGKQREPPPLPEDLVESIRMTIGRVMDYICDVISCSPEQLRTPKTEASIVEDERLSRLTSRWYGTGDEVEEQPEYALILWNDEKHTVHEVENQVARACKQKRAFGKEKARETDDLGRSVVTYSKDISELLRIAGIIEGIKITVTIRSSRDTFREQMCSTMIQWLVDISGCSVGSDHHILKRTICREMLKLWRKGSEATNATIGKEGIDDHDLEDINVRPQRIGNFILQARFPAGGFFDEADDSDDDDVDAETGTAQATNGTEASQDTNDEATVESEDLMDLDIDLTSSDPDGDMEMQPTGNVEDPVEISEATLAGYPPPPPPPPPMRRSIVNRGGNSSGSEDSGDAIPPPPIPIITDLEIPQTPKAHARKVRTRPPTYWVEQPRRMSNPPLSEDIRQRVRLDWMILYDLRLWKRARVDLRDLYISTVVTVPDFKRVLGLRFAGLYTYLAQLYLIADREPDHSIIYLSLQMLTTPSITKEIVDKGGFLTNLIAILYTFLTTRQVGHPWDVSTSATLAFDAGSVQNRRMYHFFMDLKHLFASEYVQEKLRQDRRFVLQFLDLVKLPQGICPNVRAVGDHVEYETDAWIGASLLTREINRLCRQFTEAFKWKRGEDPSNIREVIRLFAKATILNSVGADRKRFIQAEVKSEVVFKKLIRPGFETCIGVQGDHGKYIASHAGAYGGELGKYDVVDYVVETEPISFHHALHYTLSWLIDDAKSMTRDELQQLLEFRRQDLEDPATLTSLIPDLDPQTYLVALFDFPLRVCAWLAQMKTSMWVRNGLSLRHQMSTYRGVAQRDLAHSRDIFLLQTAMVVCDPSRILASMVDRYSMTDWMVGNYILKPGFEETQLLDLGEDFIHLMIVLLSDRTALRTVEDEPSPQSLAIRRDITHILCFKPLSYSELCARLADKFQDLDEFQEILEDMTNYKAPEGLSDSGTFELKAECIAEIDPYIAHYSKNQRDEAKTAYRTLMAKKIGKPIAEVVYEPQFRPIKSGIFTTLSHFCRTVIFAQIIYYSLCYALYAKEYMRGIPVTRVEAYLQVVLHLVLCAVIEDGPGDGQENSFIQNCLVREAKTDPQHVNSNTIFKVLQRLLDMEDYQMICHPKIRLILTRMRQKSPGLFAEMSVKHGFSIDRSGVESPMSVPAEDLESKKKAALDRQAKVMAQFQQQQQAFLQNQGPLDWGEDDDDDVSSVATGYTEERKQWKYPSGNCILCQEETNETRLYGTFGMMMDSSIFRQTDLGDIDYISEVASTPASLDRCADHIRPFGISGQNKDQVRKLGSDGQEVYAERQGLGRGWPPSSAVRGPVSTGCGHIMHYNCFELYYSSTQRRQANHIVRNHPERLDHKEFVCPLCKALGNTFLPIIWKGKDEAFPGVLQTDSSFDDWLNNRIGITVSRFNKSKSATLGADDFKSLFNTRHIELFVNYTVQNAIPPLANRFSHLLGSDRLNTSPPPITHRARMPGNYPVEETTPTMFWPVTAGTPEAVALNELVLIYQRIRETMRRNDLGSRSTHPRPAGMGEDLTSTNSLVQTLGFSITATEIQHRGLESEPGSTLLNKISPLTLTHLRILSETASSYIAVGALQNQGNNRTNLEFLESYSRQLLQLFAGHRKIYDFGEQPWRTAQQPCPAALVQDSFILLAECAIYLVPALGLDIHHIIRLCYLLELVKVTVGICHTGDKFPPADLAFADNKAHIPQETLSAFHGFIENIYQVCSQQYAPQAPLIPSVESLRSICALVSTYALPFLRKTTILLHARYGVDFPNAGFMDIELSETERLTRLLRLPSLTEMFSSFSAPLRHDEQASELGFMITGWIQHWQWMRGQETLRRASLTGIRPFHPGIFELIGLPKNYDTLIDEMMRRRCPTTGKDLSDPCVCLFCGDIFCSQANCCYRDKLGGCNQHMAK